MFYSRKDVTVIILAGGLGRRMNGKNKGLLPLKGKMLVEHAIDKLKSQTPHIIINANNDLSRYEISGYPVIKDKFSDNQGPLAGILSCQREISTPLVLTVPCDTPLLPNDLLTTMLNSYKENSPEELCVAHDGKRLQNLFMLFNVDLLSNLNAFFVADNRKVADWIHNQKFTQVDFSSQTTKFININTEDTLSRIEDEVKSVK